MKSLLKFLILVFCSSVITLCSAQYKILHYFNDTAGAYPIGSLTLSTNTLYGMTPVGGANNLGCIFAIDTTGNNFRDLVDFNGPNEAGPQGSLTLSNGILYGTTISGGIYDSGCIFSYNIQTATHTVIYSFRSMGSAHDIEPYGVISDLVKAGNKLYGYFSLYGACNCSEYYSIDTNGAAMNQVQFSNPASANLVLMGNKLHVWEDAHIYCFDTNGNYDFWNLVTNTSELVSQLVLSNNKFYGIIENDTSYKGNIFSCDTNAAGYKVLYNDTIPNDFQYANLAASGGNLTGTTCFGGNNHSGSLFTLDTNGGGFIDLHDFGAAGDGLNPQGAVCISPSGKVFYGMTNSNLISANDSGYGTIFSYSDVGVGVNEKNNMPDSPNIFPNPTTGKFTINVGTQNFVSEWSVEIYNVLGEKVYSNYSLSPSEPARAGTNHYPLDLTNQPNGIYLIRILNADGTLAGQKKVVKTN